MCGCNVIVGGCRDVGALENTLGWTVVVVGVLSLCGDEECTKGAMAGEKAGVEVFSVGANKHLSNLAMYHCNRAAYLLALD